MRTRNLIAVAVVLCAVAASAIVFADLSEEGIGNGGNQNVEIERDPPGDGSCYCPAVWNPVICGNAAGEVKKFSSPCIAGCYGFTRCTEIRPQPRP